MTVQLGVSNNKSQEILLKDANAAAFLKVLNHVVVKVGVGFQILIQNHYSKSSNNYFLNNGTQKTWGLKKYQLGGFIN